MTLAISLNYGITRLVPRSVSIATAVLDGVPQTSGVRWSVFPEGACILATEQGKAWLTGATPGPFGLVCIAGGQAASTVGMVLSPAPVPPPVVVPPVVVPPAAKGKLIRYWLQLWFTDFFYTWGVPPASLVLEKAVALYYDGSLSGNVSRHERMKVFNPNMLFMPYTVQYTMILSGTNEPSLASVYADDLTAWAAAQSLTAAEVEAMWLQNPDGTRVKISIWGSARNIGDPRNVNWRKYTIDRYQRMAKVSPAITGLFIDEFGSNQVNSNFKLGAGGSATTLQAIIDAETSLMLAISSALAPGKLIVNTASYEFQGDVDIAHAAGGVHMEQANVPMSLDWWNSTWPYIDRLMAAKVLVNLVCAYGFGEYDGVKDANGVHMDTHRGKLLELAGYYMLVTDPMLLALHLENAWNYAPLTYKLAECDFELGLPKSVRTKNAGIFLREFDHGIVLVNPVKDRLPANYAVTTSILLPTDRKYAQVAADGSIGPVVTSISLRCPEAAILAVVP